MNSKRDSVKFNGILLNTKYAIKKKPDERISPDIKSEQNLLNKKKSICCILVNVEKYLGTIQMNVTKKVKIYLIFSNKFYPFPFQKRDQKYFQLYGLYLVFVTL